MTPGVPPPGRPLRLVGRRLPVDRPAVMAVVNRTPDSFYAAARSADDGAALAAVDRAVSDGADLVDIGGVRAGRGPEVGAQEELDRVLPLVHLVRRQHPHLAVSVDTWRSEVAREVARAGADLLNDTWAGHDPAVLQVAADHGLGVVCSHTGGLSPRTDPFRPQYALAGPGPAVDAQGSGEAPEPLDGVLQDVIRTTTAAARRAVALGVPPDAVLLDPTHDFGKNTWHSLHLTRRTQALVAQGFPVLMALSRKDFIGETLDLPVDERLEGTLAATAVAAWQGASVFRTHDVRATRRCVEMVAAVRGDRPPARAIRGLA